MALDFFKRSMRTPINASVSVKILTHHIVVRWETDMIVFPKDATAILSSNEAIGGFSLVTNNMTLWITDANNEIVNYLMDNWINT